MVDQIEFPIERVFIIYKIQVQSVGGQWYTPHCPN